MLTMVQYFRFEQDFVEDGIRCIPMIARFKLDAAGIKLKLKEWNQLTEEERVNIAEYPCASTEEIQEYAQYIRTLVLYRSGSQVQEMEVDQYPCWNKVSEIPPVLQNKLDELGLSLGIQQWQELNELQRFALLKLCRPGHENRNFPIAMHEFGLI